MYQNAPFKPQKPKFVGNFSDRLNSLSPKPQNAEYSVGNRVYNGGSNSPHSGGGLDPTGYMNRDAQAATIRQNALINYLRSKGVRS